MIRKIAEQARNSVGLIDLLREELIDHLSHVKFFATNPTGVTQDGHTRGEYTQEMAEGDSVKGGK